MTITEPAQQISKTVRVKSYTPFRQSGRLMEKHESVERINSSTFTFIHQPTIRTTEEGVQTSFWHGIKTEWDSATGKMGVKSTKFLPKRFCFPVGGIFEVSEEDRKNLLSMGLDHSDYLVEYDCLLDKLTNKKRILASKLKDSEIIVIDVNPRLEAVHNFPVNSWIGSRVNSNPLGAKWNSHFEIIGVEHSAERTYPCINFYLFIVLDCDISPDTWIYRPVAEKGRKGTTRGKVVVESPPPADDETTKKKVRGDCMVIHDDNDATALFPSSTTTTGTKSASFLLNHNANTPSVLSMTKASKQKQSSTTSMLRVNSNSQIVLQQQHHQQPPQHHQRQPQQQQPPPQQLQQPPQQPQQHQHQQQEEAATQQFEILQEEAATQQFEILQEEAATQQFEILADNFKGILKAMKDKLASRIDALVPARITSSMTLFSGEGFERRVLKRDYTRAEQELMLLTLGEMEYSLQTTLLTFEC